MTEAKFNSLCSQIYDHIRSRTPYDTGNLYKEATQIHRLGGAKIKIFVDESIAPYFALVNNEPTLSVYKYQLLPVNGKLTKDKSKPKIKRTYTNKNYKYFERALEEVLQDIAKETGAVLIYD